MFCMRNVVVSISTFVISCLFLVGCKTPELEVGSLGKVLPAPALKGANPLDQNTEGYGLFEGTCDPRVSSLFVSFDKQLWSIPKATPDVTGTTVPVGTANDINCADGTFKFYLTKADILDQWGVDIGDDTVDVNAIYMKGATAIGDTSLLEMRKSPQNGGGKVTTVALEKTFIPGFAGVSQCAEFELVARNAEGYESSVTQATSVSLQESIAGTAYANASFFTDSSCASTATSTVSIPAKQSRLKVYYRFSDTNIDVAEAFKFKAAAASLTAQATPTAVTLRQSDRHYLWMHADGGRALANDCLAINMNYSRYDSGYSSIYTDSISFQIADTKLKFYGTDSTCTTRPSGNTLSYSGSGGGQTFYVKYVDNTNTSVPFVSATIAATSSNSTADFIPLKLQFDRSGKNVVNKADLWMSDKIGRGTCEPIQVVVSNENRTPIKATTAVAVLVSTNGSGEFYSDNGCTNQTTEFAVAAGSSKAQGYYRATPSTVNAAQVLKAQIDGLSSSEVIRNISVVGKATKIYAQLQVYDATTQTYSNTINQQCQKVKRTVMLADDIGGVNYQNNFGLDLGLNTVSNNLSGVSFFASETDCTNNLNSAPHGYSILSIGAIAQTDYFYMRVPYVQAEMTMNIAYPMATPGVYLNPGSVSLIINIP